jgi:hypothetical protein
MLLFISANVILVGPGMPHDSADPNKHGYLA